MRLRACIDVLLLCATGCAALPERVRIEVDGRTIEVRQEGLGAAGLSGRWSASPACRAATELPLEDVASVRRAGGDVIEIEKAGGEPVRLYRCSR